MRHISSEKMAVKEGLSQDEKDMWKNLFSMSKMVKVLYEDYLEQKRSVQGNIQRTTKEKKD
jgi:hypothetical protein